MNVAMTIAGSDSGGGAGIQADLKTFEAHGVFGVSAVTSVTAQNTMGVRAVHDIPPDVIAAQLDALFDDFDIRAVKIGMLSRRDTIELVAHVLRTRARRIPVVLDPVMVATSGDRLLEPGAIGALIAELLPLATIVTPNAPEAAVLTGLEVTDFTGMRAAGSAVRALGARAVLMKGGHVATEITGLTGPQSVDLLFDGDAVAVLPMPWIDTVHTHGTGCTLSSAIAANLANGASLADAVRRAKSYVFEAIAHAPGIGHGHGPLLHRWRTAMQELERRAALEGE